MKRFMTVVGIGAVLGSSILVYSILGVPNRSGNAVSLASPAAQVRGQPCSKEYHDRITTQGPDGKQYPTWHPPVDPSTGCTFGHEHGDDPRTSLADPTLPAFGYAAVKMGMNEPHVGFKVYVVNTTDRLDDGKAIFGSIRYVVHHGTGGVKRYAEQMHSFEYDAKFLDGREAHINAMADTGDRISSVCDSPRAHRTVATTTCGDPYEIWTFTMKIGDPPGGPSEPYRLLVQGSSAVFDPVLAADKNDLSKVVYNQATKDNPANTSKTIDPLSPDAWYRGCRREAYFGHGRWWNAGLPSVFYTDAHGREVAQSHPEAIRQEVSSVTYVNDDLFNFTRDHCAPGVHAPN